MAADWGVLRKPNKGRAGASACDTGEWIPPCSAHLVPTQKEDAIEYQQDCADGQPHRRPRAAFAAKRRLGSERLAAVARGPPRRPDISSLLASPPRPARPRPQPPGP